MAVFIGVIAAIGWVISYIYGNVALTPWIVAAAAIYAIIQYFLASKLAVAATGAREIKKAGLELSLWPIATVEDADLAVAFGANIICTDIPSQLMPKKPAQP